MKRYKVTIPYRGHIPGVGRGPFRTPVFISEEVYNNITKIGIKVNIIEDKVVELNLPIIDTAKTDNINNKIENTIVENNSTNETENENIETSNEEESPAESDEVEDIENSEETENDILINCPDLEKANQSVYQYKFLTSKNICKKILNARMIQYEEDASLPTLRQLVYKSNPVQKE